MFLIRGPEAGIVIPSVIGNPRTVVVMFCKSLDPTK